MMSCTKSVTLHFMVKYPDPKQQAKSKWKT